MDKNTILAIVLSIAVLFGYESIFVAPKRAEMLKKAQLARVNEVKTESSVSSASSSVPETKDQKTTNTVVDAKISDLKSTNSIISLSNVGGSLHKIEFLPNNKALSLTGLLDISGFDLAEFNLVNATNNLVSYVYKDKNWQISKNFEIVDSHLIKVRMEIKNVSEISILNNLQFKAIGIDSARMDISNRRETMLDEYAISTDKKILRKGGAFKFNAKENKTDLAKINWVAFREHFMAVIVKPEFETKGYEINTVTENKLNIFVTPKEENMRPGESKTYEFSIYTGPQDATLMKTYGKGFETALAFFNWPLFNWVAMGIYYTIPVIHSIVKSWGLSIILIGMIIYGMTYPLTIKSMLSMRKMQEMQPKLMALKERYKNDPQKLNTETMEIYRREKINPLGGCLPFLLQMPFFLAIYQVLWRSSYFEGKGFLWIKDLTQADKLFILPFSLPFLGNEFNILPIIMAIVMFFQQKISAKNAIVADETQAMQQKMMMYFFPVFIGFIFYKFASSLSLYFCMFYLFSTLTQWQMAQKTVKK